MMRKQRLKGFTLVEIAVVLVIIGLLLGGVLKGQELIASARVRNLADQQAGIQAAYFGFIDRYRFVPGDMPQTDAQNAIGVPINTGGDNNGRLADPSAGAGWTELGAVWEQLSKAGFISGDYDGDTTDADPYTREMAPNNVFQGIVVLGRHDDYRDPVEDGGGTPPTRLIMTMGQNVPVEIARELDVKIDDGEPRGGILRNAVTATTPTTEIWLANDTAISCVDTGNEIWDIQADSQGCNPAFIF